MAGLSIGVFFLVLVCQLFAQTVERLLWIGLAQAASGVLVPALTLAVGVVVPASDPDRIAGFAAAFAGLSLGAAFIGSCVTVFTRSAFLPRG